MLDTTLAAITDSGLQAVVCVAGDDQETALAIGNKGFDCVLCGSAAKGVGHTLAQGVAQLPNWRGVLIALADMPFVDPHTFRLVANAVTAQRICRPVYNGQPGHPVAFGRQFFPALCELSGDVGAQSILRRYARCLTLLPCQDAGILRDIDTPADLKPA